MDLVLPCVDLTDLRGRFQSERQAQKDADDLQRRLAEADAALNLAFLPESLPCRDKEKQFIEDILDDFVKQRKLLLCSSPDDT